MKVIAATLGVSAGSVHLWTSDIAIARAHAARNLSRSRADFSDSWSQKNRDRRKSYQEEGRRKAREADPLHLAGCMLYWAEGAKNRNSLTFGNSDREMVVFFAGFVRLFFDAPPNRFTFRLNVYTNNGLSVAEIEDHWLDALKLPRMCLRGHTLNHKPTSSSGMKPNKLPYGVGTIRVLRSTPIVQHIFGAIQEYGGFEEPRWLD
jgi:hypothetical protein